VGAGSAEEAGGAEEMAVEAASAVGGEGIASPSAGSGRLVPGTQEDPFQ
jgi:hypothetical protein